MMQAVSETVFDRALRRTHDVHFWHSKTAIDTWSASRLLTLARACAARFAKKDVSPGDRVAICLPTSPEAFAAILAAWGCGACVVLLPYSADRASDQSKFGKLSQILQLVLPQLLVHDSCLPEGVAELVPESLSRSDITSLLPTDREFNVRPNAHGPALIQLTSGSTGLPKGVPLTHAQVAANCAAIQDRVLMDGLDHVVSWLPLNHDMGFCAITVPLWVNAALTLIPPERFVRSPMTWLEAISHQRGTVSPNPAFAYTLLAKYAGRLKRAEFDLSCWRYAWVGAEPIFDKHLRSFAQAMAPFGLRDTVLKPAYGLAEAVVAVTCDVPGRAYRTLHIDADLHRSKNKIEIRSANAQGVLTFVSNGPPLANVFIKIVNETGESVGEGTEGRLLISGASVATGYLNAIDREQFFEGGWFDTGDLGFLFDSELYISGRAKDLIIRGGVNTSPQNVEWAVEQFLGLRPSQVAAFSVIDTLNAKEEVVVVVAKRPDRDAAVDLKVQVSRAVAEHAGVQVDQVVFIASGRLPKTSSGKVQRAIARKMYVNGEFDEIELET